MFTILALTLKKTFTLLVLVDPISMIPIFLAATAGMSEAGKKQFASTIGLTVTIALLLVSFLGVATLKMLGVSLGAMQVGGGIIVLLLAIAMVLGKKSDFEGTPTAAHNVESASIVPLAIPLLAGPAAFAYVMASSSWQHPVDWIHIVLPVLIVGLSCVLTFRFASFFARKTRQSTMDVIERICGFILAAMAIEMIAAGLRALFPVLVSNS